MTDEISKMLTLSMAHIKEETADMLGNNPPMVIFEKDQYGWFLHVATCDPKGLPDELAALIDHASSLGCEWLCLDQDGPINPNLPSWEW